MITELLSELREKNPPIGHVIEAHICDGELDSVGPIEEDHLLRSCDPSDHEWVMRFRRQCYRRGKACLLVVHEHGFYLARV